MLSTPFTRILGIEHPIIQAGMGSDCGVPLAAAVSNAGALGSIGSIGRSPGGLEAELTQMKSATQQPWAVNILTFDWAPFANELVDVAINAGAPVITLSFGDSVPALEKCNAAGVPTIVQVQTFAAARRTLAARPAAIVVQGNEAGGHTGHRGTMSFAAQVLDIAGDVPVVVAGGIADGRGLAAALAMGAAGVVMGTRFKATHEFGSPATQLLDAQQAAIVSNDGDATVCDEITDLALGMTWPQGVAGRVLANRFTSEWLGRSGELRAEVAGQAEPFAWTTEHNSQPDTLLNWAGESSGLIDEVLPAADVVRRAVEQAEGLLRSAGNLVAAPAGNR
jgi:nitronate monooxygenase